MVVSNECTMKDAELIVELATEGVCRNIIAYPQNVVKIVDSRNVNVVVVEFDLDQRKIIIYSEMVTLDIGYLVKKMEIEGYEIVNLYECDDVKNEIQLSSTKEEVAPIFDDCLTRLKRHFNIKTDNDFAQLLGTTPANLSNYKNDKERAFPYKWIIRLARKTGLSIEWILYG